MLTDSEFFLSWLPEQLEALSAAKRVLTDVSLVVELGDLRYSVSVAPGDVRVEKGALAQPTFRLELDLAAFQRLLAGAPAVSLDQSPALKVLSLDAETVNLVRSVPACLEARLQEGDLTYVVVFGPGQAREIGCTVSCDLGDVERVHRGETQPFELLMNGKLRIEGDAQIAMALGSVLI